MKHILSLSLLLLSFCACNNSDKQANSENDVDAARNFIQAALNGDYQKARIYMLPDSVNQERMNLIERVTLSPEEKKGLAEASINIHKVDPVNDSTTIVVYSNSFKNNRDTLKVVRQHGDWLVDFNYLFDHDPDSLSMAPPMLKTDSIQK
jgi:hypothetical protein